VSADVRALIQAHRDMIRGHEEIIARLEALDAPKAEQAAPVHIAEPHPYRGRVLREPDTDAPILAQEGN